MSKVTAALDAIAPYWKAILGFITPGAVIIGSAVLDGSDGGTAITSSEWVTAVVAMIVTGGAVYGKGNKDPQGTHQDESTQPPELGTQAGPLEPYEGKHRDDSPVDEPRYGRGGYMTGQ